ncbi:MAG: FHA domain-containing protein [Candidatus Micrarchaeota archaeon]
MEVPEAKFPLKLIGLAGELEGKEIILDRPRSSIGTRKGFHIRLTRDRKIAAVHATIENKDFSYSLGPTESLTFVNGNLIYDTTPLKHGDHIRVGHTEFLVQKHWEPAFTADEAEKFFRETIGKGHELFPAQLKKTLYRGLLLERATRFDLIQGTRPLREASLASAAKSAAEILERLEKAGLAGVGRKIVAKAMQSAQAAATAADSQETLQRLPIISQQVLHILEQAGKYTYSDLRTAYRDKQIRKLLDFLTPDIRKSDPQEITKALAGLPLQATVELRGTTRTPALVLSVPKIRRSDLNRMKAEIGWRATNAEYSDRVATDVTTNLFSSVLDASHFDWGVERPSSRSFNIAFFPHTTEAERLLKRISAALEKQRKAAKKK